MRSDLTDLPNERRWRRRRFALSALALGAALSLGDLGHAARADEIPEFRVVVHPSNSLRSVNRTFLADAFLKKVTRWEDGEMIRPVDLRPSSGVRQRFTESVLKRSVEAVRRYWQQRIFSGRNVPPPELESDESVVAHVARSPGAVGYVSGAAKLHGVRELSIK